MHDNTGETGQRGNGERNGVRVEGEGTWKKRDKREVAVPGASYSNSDLCQVGGCRLSLPSWSHPEGLRCPGVSALAMPVEGAETNAKTERKGAECMGKTWAEYRAGVGCRERAALAPADGPAPAASRSRRPPASRARVPCARVPCCWPIHTPCDVLRQGS